MWRNLRDRQLLDAYRREPQSPSAPIEDLLARLAANPAFGTIYAVTSLGELRLTTAASHEHEAQHASVHVGRTGSHFAVAFFDRNKPSASASRTCAAAELADAVELYLLRLIAEGVATQFTRITSAEEWGAVSPEGTYALFDSSLASRPSGIAFTPWRFGAETVAVFLDEDALSAARRAELVAGKPSWVHDVVFAALLPSAGDGIARLAIEIEPGADPRRCAFAAALAAQDAGRFDFEPALLRVATAERVQVDVTMTFDWDSESWSGSATIATRPA